MPSPCGFKDKVGNASNELAQSGWLLVSWAFPFSSNILCKWVVLCRDPVTLVPDKLASSCTFFVERSFWSWACLAIRSYNEAKKSEAFPNNPIVTPMTPWGFGPKTWIHDECVGWRNTQALDLNTNLQLYSFSDCTVHVRGVFIEVPWLRILHTNDHFALHLINMTTLFCEGWSGNFHFASLGFILLKFLGSFEFPTSSHLPCGMLDLVFKTLTREAKVSTSRSKLLIVHPSAWSQISPSKKSDCPSSLIPPSNQLCYNKSYLFLTSKIRDCFFLAKSYSQTVQLRGSFKRASILCLLNGKIVGNHIN